MMTINHKNMIRKSVFFLLSKFQSMELSYEEHGCHIINKFLTDILNYSISNLEDFIREIEKNIEKIFTNLAKYFEGLELEEN